MLSTLLFDSCQTGSTDELFPWPYQLPLFHSLRAEGQGVNEYWKRKHRDGRQRALWKTTEQNAQVMGNSWSEILAAEAEPNWRLCLLHTSKQSSFKGDIFSNAQGISHEIPIKDNRTFYHNFQYIFWKFSVSIFKSRLENQLSGKNLPHLSFLSIPAHEGVFFSMTRFQCWG